MCEQSNKARRQQNKVRENEIVTSQWAPLNNINQNWWQQARDCECIGTPSGLGSESDDDVWTSVGRRGQYGDTVVCRSPHRRVYKSLPVFVVHTKVCFASEGHRLFGILFIFNMIALERRVRDLFWLLLMENGRNANYIKIRHVMNNYDDAWWVVFW